MQKQTNNTTTKQPLTPTLRFPQFTEQWEEKKLGEVATFFSGGTPLTTNRSYFEGTIPFIRSGEINSDKTEQFISEEGLKKSSAKMVEKGDLIFALYGATSGEVGISKIKGAINQAILCIRTENNTRYIMNWLATNKDNILNKYLQGGQGNLSAEIIKLLPIPLPSLPEQQKIADFLSAVDEKLQALKKKKHLLEQYKKGIMQQIFTQTLRFKDEQGNDFPEWEERKLGEVCTIKSGLSLDQNDKKEGYQVTRIETISDGKINLNKIGYVSTQEDISNYKLKKGDILFSNINSVSHIGKTALVHHELNLYHGMNLLRLVAATNTHSVFLFYYLNTEFNRNYFKQICNKAVSQASINQTELGKTPIPLPSLPEQQKIATFLSALDEKINKVQEQIAQVEAWKKGLLQQLFPQ